MKLSAFVAAHAQSAPDKVAVRCSADTIAGASRRFQPAPRPLERLSDARPDDGASAAQRAVHAGLQRARALEKVRSLPADAVIFDLRVAALVMGTSDLTKDLHARHTRDRLPLLTSLELCVLAARSEPALSHLDQLQGFAADRDHRRRAAHRGGRDVAVLRPLHQVEALRRDVALTLAEIFA